MSLQPLLESLLGRNLPVRVTAYDGSSIGPPDAAATVVIRNPAAIQRIVTGLGRELGFARAYVAGDVEIEGDVFELFRLQERIPSPRFTPGQLLQVARLLHLRDLRPLAPPPEEMPKRRLGLHTIRRDAEAIRQRVRRHGPVAAATERVDRLRVVLDRLAAGGAAVAAVGALDASLRH